MSRIVLNSIEYRISNLFSVSCGKGKWRRQFPSSRYFIEQHHIVYNRVFQRSHTYSTLTFKQIKQRVITRYENGQLTYDITLTFIHALILTLYNATMNIFYCLSYSHLPRGILMAVFQFRNCPFSWPFARLMWNFTGFRTRKWGVCTVTAIYRWYV